MNPSRQATLSPARAIHEHAQDAEQLRRRLNLVQHDEPSFGAQGEFRVLQPPAIRL